jgi:D-3-phosphoglycerate dehydrogenase / 2-oxoglutarate reductase
MAERLIRPKVVLAEPMAAAGIAALSVDCDVVDLSGSSRSHLASALADASGLVVRSATRVDDELISMGPNLRVIGRAGVGVDNIDVAAATRRGVLVVNAPLANTVSAAEHAFALILSIARHVPQAHATTRQGVWDRKNFTGVELSGKTLGVVGLGRIGSLVAQRAGAFDMRVLAYDPFVGPERARRMGVEMVDLEGLLENSDFISIHLPMTLDTEGLFGKDTLARCKPGVRIVNTSRGGIIDELALAEAVRSGQVAGAALDVFASEPPIDSPLFELPAVIVTPHLGASTIEAQDKAGVQVAEAVVAALRGELVASAVNVDLGGEVSDEVQQFLPVAEQLGRVFIGLAGGAPDEILVEARGRIAEGETKPLGLAVLKGWLQAVSTDPVSYVNVRALAEARGIGLVLEHSEESPDYVSVLTVSGLVGGIDVSVAATVSRKGPVLVEILGHDLELPISRHMLILSNTDVPGVIGRVGTYLGDESINIANMVVGRTRKPNDGAMMGLNLDQPMTEAQVSQIKKMPGIVEARYVEVGNVAAEPTSYLQGRLRFE